MTKEELEKESEEWIAKNSKEFITNPNYSPFDYAEAIYLAGAEPREKRIAELEFTNKNISNECHKLVDSLEKKQNEVAELKLELTKKADTNHSLVEQMVDLESENAELKEDNGKLNRKVELLKEELINPKDKCYSKDKEQLTKAKELLKDVYKIAMSDWNDVKWHDQVLREAEQFIKEIHV